MKNIKAIVCTYGYKLIFVDEQYSKSYKTYFSEKGFNKFTNDMVNEKECCCGVIEREFKTFLVITKIKYRYFKNFKNVGFAKKHKKG